MIARRKNRSSVTIEKVRRAGFTFNVDTWLRFERKSLENSGKGSRYGASDRFENPVRSRSNRLSSATIVPKVLYNIFPYRRKKRDNRIFRSSTAHRLWKYFLVEENEPKRKCRRSAVQNLSKKSGKKTGWQRTRSVRRKMFARRESFARIAEFATIRFCSRLFVRNAIPLIVSIFYRTRRTTRAISCSY